MKKLIFLYLIFCVIKSTQAQKSKSYDVIVYGATSAGVIAAMSVQKQGKSVLVIEPFSHIGGLTAGGLGQTDIGNKYAITGLSRDFYRQIGKHYGKFEQWTFEPSVAKNIFLEQLKRAKIEVLTQTKLVKVLKKGLEIKAVEVIIKEKNQKLKAKMFIDCSYEGDLMAKSGVSYTIGREANSKYNETYNGVQMLDKHQFPDNIDPWKIKGDSTSGLLWGISSEKIAKTGSGDNKVQAYNFRLCLTDSLENKIEIKKPENFNPENYELLLRYIEAKQPHELNWALMHLQPMPHRKVDINNSGPFSTNFIGKNYEYPDANYNERVKTQKEHEEYVKGFLYFLGNDSRVPEHLRFEMNKWGYPKDEYIENGNLSPQMYVREARRMVSDVVMSEKHCVGKETVEDGIGMAAYTMDSHNTQRVIVKDKNGNYQVKNEGDVQKGLGGLDPYPISYRSIIPKNTECNNLLVPVCISASHIAFGSIRMEPVFMVLAQSAAVAAVEAINSGKNLHEIDYKTIQNKLKKNPYLDNRPADILIDNSDLEGFTSTGIWNEVDKGYGRYGKDYIVSNTKNNSAKFSSKTKSNGKFNAYIYIPKIENHVKLVNAILYINGVKVRKSISTNSDDSDWYYLGTYALQKGKLNEIMISTTEDGTLVADAVLWIAEM